MPELLPGPSVTLEGRCYNLKTLRMSPPLPERLKPGELMSGSSEAGLAPARTIGAVPVGYRTAAEPRAARRQGRGVGCWRGRACLTATTDRRPHLHNQ